MSRISDIPGEEQATATLGLDDPLDVLGIVIYFNIVTVFFF